MKTHPTLILFAFVGLVSASQPLLAANSKADARAAALVSALQAVSPDPLGGRLGLSAAAGVEVITQSSPSRVTAQTSNAQLDQRAYNAWKRTQKS